jgi:hypothetical protein
MACTGHKKGGHKGAPKAKHKESAKKACAVKLQAKIKREKANVKEAYKYIKSHH